jgi:hypothetical protein
MDEPSTYDRKLIWFVSGLLLTCALAIALLIGLSTTFGGISEQKAVGVAAVAGGLAEAYSSFGLLLALIFPVAAIVLLAKSFSGNHRLRSVFSVLCICWNALALAFGGLFVWLWFIYLPRLGR